MMPSCKWPVVFIPIARHKCFVEVGELRARGCLLKSMCILNNYFRSISGHTCIWSFLVHILTLNRICFQGERDVLDHLAQIKAPTYLPQNDVRIPTGTVMCIEVICVWVTWSASFPGSLFSASKEERPSERGWNYILCVPSCHNYQEIDISSFILTLSSPKGPQWLVKLSGVRQSKM